LANVNAPQSTRNCNWSMPTAYAPAHRFLRGVGRRCAMVRPLFGGRVMRANKIASVVVALLIVGGGSRMAFGDDRSEAREHYLKGTKAFDLGAYEEAIAEYTAAYRLKNDPALLYNLAQAARLAGHAAEALRFYRVFLTKVPTTPNRDECERKISEL